MVATDRRVVGADRDASEGGHVEGAIDEPAADETLATAFVGAAQEERADQSPEGPVFQLRGVSFRYADGTLALHDLDLEVLPRQVTVLFGPARAGKTTLLRLLNRLCDLDDGATHDGDVLFHGHDVFRTDVRVSQLRRRVSMVFAIPTPLPGSIAANVSYGLRMAGIRDTRILSARIEVALRQAALWDEVKDRLRTSAFALSGGQQQRLCLARCLALEPEVVLLDNPTSGLDPISTAIVEDSLLELKRQYTIVIVPHSVQQAARLADRAAFLLDGQLIEHGPGVAVFTQPADRRTEDYITGRFG